MTQAADMMIVDEVFLVGNKLIFAGMFQRTDQKEMKGTMEILVNGKPLQKIRIEGEIFDNTKKISLWATMPIGLDISVLKKNKISLRWENDRNC